MERAESRRGEIAFQDVRAFFTLLFIASPTPEGNIYYLIMHINKWHIKNPDTCTLKGHCIEFGVV